MSGVEGFRDRLRRLRREGPEVAPDSPASESGALPVWMQKRLERDSSSSAPELDPRLALIPTSEGAPLDLRASPGPAGETSARHTLFDLDHVHGGMQLGEVAHAAREDLALVTGDEGLLELDLERAVYLDTETTGLSGGAGTYVYLVGLGSFVDGRFEVWQGFLPGPADEEALLAECTARIASSSGVVSFFGKSFDRHRLEDKMRIVGVEPPFEALPHLDLYHPCRRLYRKAYEDGRLRTMERELCGVEREDDLPGAFAPAAWFDFLAERPHRLEGVFRHNLDDVLSLVTLAAHLGRSRVEHRHAGETLPGSESCRALGLARSLAGRGSRDEACEWLERALDRGATPVRDLRLERAQLLRLGGRRDEALKALAELVGGPEDHCSVPALIELAKLLEHHTKDSAGALECCRSARVLLDRHHVGGDYARLLRDLEKRTARLAARAERE